MSEHPTNFSGLFPRYFIVPRYNKTWAVVQELGAEYTFLVEVPTLEEANAFLKLLR